MEKSINSDVIRGHIDTIILYSLLDYDKFAQQISDAIAAKSDGKYLINQATLYSSLKRLENLKYVNAYWNDSPDGRRRFFRITQKGKEIVDNNVSDWSVSRSIIDKLIDFAPAENDISANNIQPSIVYVSSPVEKVAISENSIILDNSEQVKVDNIKESNVTNNGLNESNSTEIKQNVSNSTSEVKDVNYKSILGGLKKLTNNTDKNIEIVSENTENVTPVAKSFEEKISNDSCIKSFSETINYPDKFKRPFTSGKVDLTDIVDIASKNGYIVRVSSKDKIKNSSTNFDNVNNAVSGDVYINKVRFFSALSMFFVVLLELLFISFNYKSLIQYSSASIIIAFFVFLIYPAITCFAYYLRPKAVSKPIKADSIFTVAIIVFNLILVTFGLNLVFNVDFSNKFLLFICLLVPISVYLDVLIYYIVKYFLAKKQSFRVK